MKSKNGDIILQTEVGSTAWGLSLDPANSDSDQMGIMIEDFEEAVKIGDPFEQVVFRTATERTGIHDAPSLPGDIDLTIYSLRKWVRLALKGNPTVLTLLFAPQEKWLNGDARGVGLQAMAPRIVSRQAGKAFLGYLQAQRMRLLGERGGLDVHRKELEAKFGYDTKYAMHMLRLGVQGIDLLRTGKISMPLRQDDREYLLAVRRGDSSKQAVLTKAGELEREIKDLIETSPLPEAPDTKGVEEWMQREYWETWRARYGNPTHPLYRGLSPDENVKWLEATKEIQE